MEWSLSGNAFKTFARSVTCLARIGNELAIQASPSQVLSGQPNRGPFSFNFFHRLIQPYSWMFYTRKQ